MEPAITIIIPTFNCSDVIEGALTSISTQRFREVEVLIMDNFSTDGTSLIVGRFTTLLKGLQFIQARDNGIYDAMNAGIKRANANWLFFMGADDRLHDDQVLLRIFEFINTNVDIVYGDVVWMPEGRVEKGPWESTSILNFSINHQRIFYKKHLFQKYGYYNVKYNIHADYAFNIKVFSDCSLNKIYINFPITKYNALGFSSGKIDIKFWDDWEILMLKPLNRILPVSRIYKRLWWYCWYKMHTGEYRKAALLFFKILLNAPNYSFIKHTASQFVFSIRKRKHL